MGLESDRLVEWILEQQLPFDSLYYRSASRSKAFRERPHVNYSAPWRQNIWAFTDGGVPTKKGIEHWVEWVKVRIYLANFSTMSRKRRELLPGYCYHITIRCNNREFRLTRFECREVLLFAIKKCQAKFGFKLYALCIMSNHVHYLIEPQQPEDLPKIMHWLNWYTAMCFNRMLNRTGHFWEKRYHSTGFPVSDKRRALNTLRYIHGNPKAANLQQGWFYDFSNYGSYDRLTNDGITQWHPAFLALGTTLEICAAAYRKFCKKYKPQPKPEKKNYWGSKLLAKLRIRGKPTKVSPGQKSLWDEWDAPVEEIRQVAEKFVLANCFDPKFASGLFRATAENNTE